MTEKEKDAVRQAFAEVFGYDTDPFAPDTGELRRHADGIMSIGQAWAGGSDDGAGIMAHVLGAAREAVALVLSGKLDGIEAEEDDTEEDDTEEDDRK